MSGFDTSPFEEQLTRIRAALREGVDPRPLIEEAAALPDAEPFARLLFGLADADRIDDAMRARIAAALERLSDAALLYVYSQPEAGREPAEAHLAALAEEALRTWPLGRIQALSLLSRWLRHRAPAVHAGLRTEADRRAAEALSGESGDAGAPPLESWLLFLDGSRLRELAAEPRSSVLVNDAVGLSVEALASSPKSISQANAEALLARRVYAEAGHFFFELLQNADDAGASRWATEVHADRVIVSHDGEPFSLRDVVGVLSIGQTTKRVEQIGFFGVGFKSVYEISSRPRVHSGVFDFEIAHVSIPRLVARPGAEATDDETTLVLPLDPGVDASAVHRQALEIPPETILTLPNLRAFALEGPTGERVEWREEPFEEGAVLLRDGGVEARRYRYISRQFRYGGEREEGRSAESRVLVAIAVDEGGKPRPIEGPSLFAFLPTREDTGLRVLVHARFDVTVDRERLEHESRWNAALLRSAGEALAEAALSLASDGHEPLEVLPHPDEVSPRVAPLAEALCEALRDQPCLPAADGSRVAPSASARVKPALARPLAGLDLGGGRRALAHLAPREAGVAHSLGASSFGGPELVAFARERLEVGAPPPEWLCRPVLQALATAEVPDTELRDLPLLHEGAGLLSSAEEARLGSPALAELYAGVRPIVSTDAHGSLPDALRARLSVAHLDPRELWVDLTMPDRHGALVEREGPLFDAIDEMSDAELEGIRDASIWRDREGRRVAISEGLRRLDPALAPLRDELGLSLPLLDETTEAGHPRLARRWIPLFGLAELVDELSRGLSLSAEATAGLRTIVDREGTTLPRALCRRVAALAIFPDHHGALRALVGEERALLSIDTALPGVLPRWPWLAEPERPFVELAETAFVDADRIADALCQGGHLPAIAPASVPRLLEWLADRAEGLSSARADRLALAPIWLDGEGNARALDELREGRGSESVARFYAATRARAVAHPSSLALARALRLSGRIPAPDLSAVVADIGARGGKLDVPRELLAAVLEEAAGALPPSELAGVVALPLFVDEEGERRPLGSWGEGDESAAHRAGPFRAALRAGRTPLLSEEDERLLEALLSAVGPAPATVVDVLVRASNDAALLRDPGELREALEEHGQSLDERALAALAELPLFESEDGAAHRSRELCLRAPLVEAWGEARLAAASLESELLDAGQEALVSRLGLPTRPMAELLGEVVLPRLVADGELASQPPPFSDRSSLVALATSAHASGLDPGAHPLALDARGLVVRGALADGGEPLRELAHALGLEARIADAAWTEALPAELRAAMLVSLPVRVVAASLAGACPEEAPRHGHPVLKDLGPLYGWLRENAEEIAADEATMGALGSAAVLPSQRGTLRAPGEMVLDASFGDVGLDWGLAEDVPGDVAEWLGGVFELGRKQRRAAVEHVLDGLDAAAVNDDGPRAAELIRFLSVALGGRDAGADELEERARRLNVRARLRVPLSNGEWEKPRRALMTAPGGASELEFLAGPPPARVALPALDPSARRLLRACGARTDLAEDRVERCLDGADLREGPGARVALARYVVSRAREPGDLRSRWRLEERRWVPDALGALHRPSELLYPDALAASLFEGHEGRFPDPEVVLELSAEDAARFGFARAGDLSPAEVAKMLDGRAASPALLDWLEEGLRSGSLESAAVRAAFRETLLLEDDEGVLRTAGQLCRRGNRELFGPFRGDYSAAAQMPKLTRALSIAERPKSETILAFFAEMRDRHEDLEEDERLALGAVLPDCLERLGEAVEAGAELRLPEGSPLVGMRGGEAVLTRLGDASLRMLEPQALAGALPPDALDDWIDPLPTWGRGDGLRSLLEEAGVPDLRVDFELREALPGPAIEHRRAEAEALHRDLARVLGDSVGKRARLVESLAVVGELAYRAGDARRSAVKVEATTGVDAAVHADTLWLTPAVLALPELLAPALAAEPSRRAAFARWLGERSWETLPKRLARRDEAKPVTEERSFLSSLRRMLGGSERPARAERRPRPREGRAGRASHDDRFFRPDDHIASQFHGGEGWTESRHARPDFGFAFRPPTLPSPWLYAPKLVAVDFERRGQLWTRATLSRPEVRDVAGELLLRGRLPKGDATLPIPLYARLDEVRVDGVEARTIVGAAGETILRLGEATDVRLKVALGRAPHPAQLVAAGARGAASTSFVPDDELPDEVLDFVDGLDAGLPPFERAAAVVDFIRRRYRYDPSYLEDDGLGAWMARVTRGRAQAHVAALHLGADGGALGRGVCYELNTLACELLRRVHVPAAIATGWLLDGGSLSEPDHLWALALLQEPGGAPAWVPIDASTTARGRPLRVPQRPPGKFRAPRVAAKKTPTAPAWQSTAGRRAPGAAARTKPKKTKRRRIPRGELLRVLHHLERTTGRQLSEDERASLERALEDPRAAERLLERLLD